MKRRQRILAHTAALVGAIMVLPASAGAFDLTGAWATRADRCSKVFTRNGRTNDIAFTRLSGAYGGGFIAEPKRLRGKSRICAIKSRKDDGQSVNMIVGCASGIMVSDIQLFFRIINDESISRSFPGIEGMDVTYHRCKI